MHTWDALSDSGEIDEIQLKQSHPHTLSSQINAVIQQADWSSQGTSVDNDVTMQVFEGRYEGKPETETVESEEVLPDGTIVKRRVTKTKTSETMIRRVVTEGDNVERDERVATETRQLTPDVDMEEWEETLPDGTVVRRRVVRTRETILTSELEQGTEHYPGQAHGIPASSTPDSADEPIASQTEPPVESVLTLASHVVTEAAPEITRHVTPVESTVSVSGFPS